MSGLQLITPDWPAPDNIVALTTTRIGGVSSAPFNRFNVASHVDDKAVSVEANRQTLLNHCEGLHKIQWLNQIHSAKVIMAGAETCPDADASMTAEPALACAVMTADCLPLLVCDKYGYQVAAAHAGWRGLAGGVIDNTVAAFSAAGNELMVWLGPAISQANFEVGEEVLQQFLAAFETKDQDKVYRAFQPNRQHEGHYFADLYQLARIRLNALGIANIYGGNLCCFEDSQRFYSYRRDGQTGRMATLIYKRPT